MKSPVFWMAAALFLPLPPAGAETVKDREGAVRNDKAAMEKDTRWIYNDCKSGLAEARRTGKPLLVVLRCVPCLACSGIDAQVLLQEPQLSKLLNQFVCVRLINANALDLSLLQVDYDLSFSAVFLHADGTVYGRYGSWTHQKNAQDKATAGFQAALEGALALHAGYPANKPALAGKQGAPSRYKTPVNIPTLGAKYRLELDWNGKVVPSCVHCHQISDALRLEQRNQTGLLSRDLIFPWPAPETVGLTLSEAQPHQVESVRPNSAAARAGLNPGDELITVAGQPILSIADVSWVLHHAPEQGALTATVRRAGAERTVSLALPADWRAHSDISRRVGTWGLRGMATGGLQLEALSDAERAELRLEPRQLGLRVKHAGEYGKHAAAKKAGFRKGDILLRIEPWQDRLTEGELIGRILQQFKPGQQLATTILRAGERLELMLPVQ